MNPEDDVIDRIDTLVNESLAKSWDEISGYDNNINQESCGHCGLDWHGLPQGGCPGSTFIGPRPPNVWAKEWDRWRNANQRPNEYSEMAGPVDGYPWVIPDDPLEPSAWGMPIDVQFPASSPLSVMRASLNQMRGLFQQVTDGFIREEVEQIEQTPQQRALPRPSTTPPMWAQQPNQRRRNRRTTR